MKTSQGVIDEMEDKNNSVPADLQPAVNQTTLSPSNCHVTAETGCDLLPAPPEKPLSSDYSGSGCVSPSNCHVTAETGCDLLPASPEKTLSSVYSASGCVSPSNCHVTAEAGCDLLPAPPEKPLPTDCCGGGCVPCVMDIYEQELKLWEEECRAIREGKPRSTKRNSDAANDSPVLSAESYTAFRLEHIQQLTSDTTSDTSVYRFHIPGDRRLGLAVGQHVILRGTVAGRSVTRQYTPVSPLDATGYFDVLIKVYQTGVMSQYVRTWQVGDMVEWRGPFGTFTYRANQYRQVVMVAAGTGITPMLQVARCVLGNPEDETVVKLLYACRRYGDVLLKHVLDEMAGFWNFSVSYWLSQEDQKSFKPKYGDEIHHRRLDRTVLSAELPPPGSEVLILVCGTRSFDSDMLDHLRALGFPQECVFKF